MSEISTVFLGEFLTIDDVRKGWEKIGNALDGVSLLVSAYEYEGYSGNGFLLGIKDGKLVEANGSHCSCYGLEWEGWEDTSAEALMNRRFYGCAGVAEAVAVALDAIAKAEGRP